MSSFYAIDDDGCCVSNAKTACHIYLKFLDRPDILKQKGEDTDIIALKDQLGVQW